MSKIVIDSNVFIALANDQDSLHTKARDFLPYVQKHQIFINYHIFSEVVTVISQRSSKSQATFQGNVLKQNSDVFFCLGEMLDNETWKIFTKIQKKNMSYADCSILALMQLYKIGTLISFDSKDFASLQKKYNFKLLS